MDKKKNFISEPPPGYGFVNKSEDEKLWEEMNRPFIEKIQSFTRMLRRNEMINKIVVTPKSE